MNTIRDTIERYAATFSAGDREAWLALWADDATMEDPVGTPLKHGKDVIGAFYDESRTAVDLGVDLVLQGEPLVVGREAAFLMDVVVHTADGEMRMPVIDVMTFDDDARITSQRAFVDYGLLR